VGGTSSPLKSLNQNTRAYTHTHTTHAHRHTGTHARGNVRAGPTATLQRWTRQRGARSGPPTAREHALAHASTRTRTSTRTPASTRQQKRASRVREASTEHPAARTCGVGLPRSGDATCPPLAPCTHAVLSVRSGTAAPGRVGASWDCIMHSRSRRGTREQQMHTSSAHAHASQPQRDMRVHAHDARNAGAAGTHAAKVHAQPANGWAATYGLAGNGRDVHGAASDETERDLHTGSHGIAAAAAAAAATPAATATPLPDGRRPQAVMRRP
jgi:hypothetical protein